MKYLIFIFTFSFGVFASPDFLFDFESVKTHIEERFAHTAVETYPFPYLVVENVLPEDFYSLLLENWPEKTLAESPTSQLHWRKGLSIGNANWQSQDAYSFELWRQFALFVVDGVIKRQIANKFHPFSSARFEDHIEGKFLCNAIDIGDHRILEDLGNGIPPHIDPVAIFAPLFIYFPDLDDHQHICLGTHFYRHLQNKRSVDILYDPPHHLKLVKIAPYKPNTLCSFMQTPYTWHGSEINNPFGNYVRKLYGTQIYLSPQFLTQYYRSTFTPPPGLDEQDTY